MGEAGRAHECAGEQAVALGPSRRLVGSAVAEHRVQDDAERVEVGGGDRSVPELIASHVLRIADDGRVAGGAGWLLVACGSRGS